MLYLAGVAVSSDVSRKEAGVHSEREEPSQINVILQQKLPAAKFEHSCTVYKQRCTAILLVASVAVKTQDTIPYFGYHFYCF